MFLVSLQQELADVVPASFVDLLFFGLSAAEDSIYYPGSWCKTMGLLVLDEWE
jgi:hypothetical protein